MKKFFSFKRFSLIIGLSFCFYNASMAQMIGVSSNENSAILKGVEKDSTKEPPKRSFFQASFSYLSNAVYNGRHDFLTTPYFTLLIGYYNKSGFYVTGSMAYLHNALESRIDLFDF